MEKSAEYMQYIRENICSICADSDEKGSCTLSQKEFCAVEIYLPKIVNIVHNENIDDTDKLRMILKDRVCSECRTADDKDHCSLRDDANCALDRYFGLIIEAVVKVDGGRI